jgi:diguanylate cyclase (GGDEF)-like protein
MGLRKSIIAKMAASGLERASDELAREQFRLLSEQIPFLYAALVVNSLFLAAATYVDAGFFRAFVLPAILIPMMVFRMMTWTKRSKQSHLEMDIKVVRAALRGNVIAANVMSVLLGGWAMILVPGLAHEHQAYVPLFTILSMITVAYCLVHLPAAAYSVLINGSLVIALAMATTGDMMLVAMSGNIILVSMLITYMISRQFRQFSRTVASHSEIVEQRAYANELAHHDQLTGLPNRRALVEMLHALRRENAEAPVAMVMLDLNGFKPVNDTYGHSAGDELLVTVGRRLRDVVGGGGLVVRLGGDEFAILISGEMSIDPIFQLAEKMRAALSRPIKLHEHELRLSAAFGIATEATIPTDPLQLLRHADIALYESKLSESNAISLFEGSMEVRVKRRTLIEQALSDRDQMKDIKLHYQPIFEMRTATHVGFEALARWDHPVLGKISPTEFVEAAERNGLATRLTVHLFEQAVATAKQWEDDVALSFNLSGSGLGTSGLDQLLPQILAKADFDPKRLAVEVTETALLSDPSAARKVLRALQKIGVRIVLDDFGAGYASIGYLREMRFDCIKLDGSLIRDITRNARARGLLMGVLHLCQAVGAKVTAEMVETEEQLALLRPLPIANVQGYLLGRPVPADDTFAEDADKHVDRQRLLAQR